MAWNISKKGLGRLTDKSFMDTEVVFQESPENFNAALESEQTGITDNWRVRFRENFVEIVKGFCCDFEFEVHFLH